MMSSSVRAHPRSLQIWASPFTIGSCTVGPNVFTCSMRTPEATRSCSTVPTNRRPIPPRWRARPTTSNSISAHSSRCDGAAHRHGRRVPRRDVPVHMRIRPAIEQRRLRLNRAERPVPQTRKVDHRRPQRRLHRTLQHRELTRFAPGLRVVVHHGASRAKTVKAFVKVCGRHDVVLSSYGLLARDVDTLAAVEWGRVTLDEAQQVKNPYTAQAKAAQRLSAHRRIAMTGTPVENRLSELWAIMQAVNPGLLGSMTSFKERFAIPIERHGDDEAAARLQRLTGPFVLRRLKTDRSIIDDLPDKIEITEHCPLTREQATPTRLSSTTCSPQPTRPTASSGEGWCSPASPSSNRSQPPGPLRQGPQRPSRPIGQAQPRRGAARRAGRRR